MTKHLRLTSVAAAVAALALTATPATAATPSQQATATARIVKPLSIVWVGDLDLGTVILGAGTWTGASVGISRAGNFSCTNPNVVCTGTRSTARYLVTGTNNQQVTVGASANLELTNQNDNTKKLMLAVDNPGTFNLGNSGAAGYPLSLGGTITVNSDTTDGTYVGTFDVTVNY